MSKRFRSRYDVTGIKPGFSSTQPSLTVQEDYLPSLITNIVNAHIPQPHKPAFYGDFTALPDDYIAALQLIRNASESFSSLPSAVRDRFGNDPAALLAFIADANNRDEAISLGLVDKSVTEAPKASPAAAELPGGTNLST